MTGIAPDEESPDRNPERWVYESIAGSIPGVELTRTVALLVQLLLFETGVIVLAVGYNRWEGLLAGTTAVVIASAGSVFLLTIGRRIRRLDVSTRYTEVLFGSGIEIVLGLGSFIALLTYLFVIDPRAGGTTLLADLLGDPLPVPAVFFTLLVLWDVCYRIGTGWWASLVGLWRSVALGETIDATTAEAFVRIDAITIAFAWTQLALVPFVTDHILLAVALLGHVVAVTLVSGSSILVLRRS
ncbi:hypothetical protein Hrd1104_06725 [Halorhabdus sp. CBA1104]|uniref:DUF7530 family protein n=1 Tax=unclassified Halorhabdus TaxID=2621901 RepID=UPI0012B3D2CD|nr:MULTISPECIES: hypothetical protein [unclassified Halorhabdus]QGN07018.1 hypothetical protein Hrd1104_06725 [Halorhabdus sp. CBA1104]